jgi:histidyl-tRNA synthetase
VALLEGLNDEQAEALLMHSLSAIGVKLQFGTRPPEAIVRRLVRKLRRENQAVGIERALGLLGQLSQIQGAPDDVLPQIESLLRSYNLPLAPLDDLRAVLDLVAAHGVGGEQLLVDVGLGRGLHYYTGAIFEIYADGIQLCGGGRYDDLVTALGGRQPTPAVGFAYGLERVTLLASRSSDSEQRPREVLVVPADDSIYPYALQVAARLRERGFVAVVDVRGRNVATNLRDAARRSVAALAIVGAEHQSQETVLWRDLATREERVISLSAV